MPLAHRHSSLCFNTNGKDTDNSTRGIKKSRTINPSSYPGCFKRTPLFTMISLKSDTYSGETYIYIFSFANNTVHFFPLFLLQNRRSSKWSAKKIVFRQPSLISHVSITVTNVKTKTTTTTKMASVCLFQQVLGTRKYPYPHPRTRYLPLRTNLIAIANLLLGSNSW